MKVLVIGSRDIQDFNLSAYIPSQTTHIISGGARGIDRLAESYADEHHLSKIIIRPMYALYGRRAPLKRNEQMVEMADNVIAIWDGVSKGTKYTIDYARKMGKAVTVDSDRSWRIACNRLCAAHDVINH